MPTGYEDIDNLTNQTNQLYDEQLKQQQNMVNTSTQQIVDEIERNKKKAEESAERTNRGLYAEYQANVNPYGVNAETMAEQGLNKSGLAETTKANYYNAYQRARTEATNNANTIKADFDAQITQARQNGDLQMAQAALDMYKQKVNDLYTTYGLKYQKQQADQAQANWQKEYDQALQQAQWQQAFNQAQFDYGKQQDELSQRNWQAQFDYNRDINDRNYQYQVARDNIADSQWQQEFDYNKDINNRNFEYQKERDAIADQQWAKQYNASRASRSSGGSSGSSGSSNNLTVSNQGSDISDYAKSVLNAVLAVRNGIAGDKSIPSARENVSNLVANGALTQDEGRYIWEKAGL